MHEFVHVEIPTRDIKRAKTFYSKIFGWTFQDFGKGYAMINNGGNNIGALMKVKKVPTKAVAQVYIGVADIDAKIKEIKAARGKIKTPKTEVPNMGWFAGFADNQGAVLFLWQPRDGARQSTPPM